MAARSRARVIGALVVYEIAVTCCERSTIGETPTVDLGKGPGGCTLDAEPEEVDAEADFAAGEMAEGCDDAPDVA